MANPALELALLLESWRAERTTTPLAVRRDQATKEGSTLAAEHDRAISLYSETLAWIKRLEKGGIDVGHFRDATPEWQAALFSFNSAWSSNPHNTVGLDSGNARLLRSLATLIEAAEAFQRKLPDSQREAIWSTLREARAFVETEERFSMPVTRHLSGILDRVEEALSRPDDADALSAFSQFTGTLLTLAAEAERRGDRDSAKSWREVASDFAVQVAAAVTASALAAGGTMVQLPM